LLIDFVIPSLYNLLNKSNKQRTSLIQADLRRSREGGSPVTTAEPDQPGAFSRGGA